MRRLSWLLLLAAGLGCQVAPPAQVPCRPQDALPASLPDPASEQPPPFDLPHLWHLTRARHPQLAEAAASVEEARGRRIQAALYPNPLFHFFGDELGGQAGPLGNLGFQL